MATDIFAKIGDIKGESLDEKHKGEVEVLSWSWGVTQTGSMHTTRGDGLPALAAASVRRGTTCSAIVRGPVIHSTVPSATAPARCSI